MSDCLLQEYEVPDFDDYDETIRRCLVCGHRICVSDGVYSGDDTIKFRCSSCGEIYTAEDLDL